MGKQSRLKRASRAIRHPAWFTFRLDQPSEWATLRIPDAHVMEFVSGASELITKTPVWSMLMWTQNEVLIPRIRQRDWTQVSSEDLLDALHKVGNIQRGVRDFLPLPYRRWSLEVRRALYLTTFLIAGHAAVEANPHETFDLPEFAHWPLQARVIFAAMKPLWYMLAQPAVTATVQHRLLDSQNADAAVLALLREASRQDDSLLGGEGERLWLPLLGTDAKTLADDMAKQFEKQNWHPVTGNKTGNVNSELIFGLEQLQGTRTAAQFMADILAGDAGGYPAQVEQNLREANTEESYYHQFKIRWNREPVDDPTSRTPFVLTEAQVDALCLSNKLRRLLMLLRQNPTQSDEALARQLTKSPQTIRNWRMELLAKLQAALPS